MTTRYDTNIQLTANGQPDRVTLVGPRVGMKYEGADVTISAGYRVNVELFATHQELNRVRQDLSVETDFSRMLGAVLPKQSRIRIREMIVYTPILPDFESLVAPSPDETTGGVRTPRTNTLRNVFEINDSMPLSTVTKIAFGYKNSFTRYQDPSLIDSMMHEARISFSQDLSRTDTATTAYSYRLFDPHGGEDTYLHTLLLGDRHEFSPILTGKAEMGGIATVLPDRDKPQYSAHGALSVSRRFKDRLQLSARLGHTVDASSGIANTVLITDSGALSLNRQFTSALSADTALNVARNYSMGKDKTTGRPIDIYSQGVSMGVHYQFTSWLTSDFEYRYYRQETKGSFQADLTRNLYSISLRAQWS